MKRWVDQRVPVVLLALGWSAAGHAGVVKASGDAPPAAARKAAAPVSFRTVNFASTEPSVYALRGEAPPIDLYAAARMATPAELLFDGEPSRPPSPTASANSALSGLDLPEPGPVSASLSTLALAVFFFLRRRR